LKAWPNATLYRTNTTVLLIGLHVGCTAAVCPKGGYTIMAATATRRQCLITASASLVSRRQPQLFAPTRMRLSGHMSPPFWPLLKTLPLAPRTAMPPNHGCKYNALQ